MSTLELTKKIEMLPPEEYSMVEEYVEKISEYVIKRQQEEAWGQIKKDLIAAEKSILEEGTVSFAELKMLHISF